MNFNFSNMLNTAQNNTLCFETSRLDSCLKKEIEKTSNRGWLRTKLLFLPFT